MAGVLSGILSGEDPPSSATFDSLSSDAKNLMWNVLHAKEAVYYRAVVNVVGSEFKHPKCQI